MSAKKKCYDKNGQETISGVQAQKHQYTIEVLNYHCLGEIISYLSPEDRLNLEQLSEKMEVASNLAWRRIKNLEMLTIFCSESIKQHSIRTSYVSQNSTKQILAQCGQYLETLHLDCCGNELMSSVVNECHNLQKLTIEYQNCGSSNFKDAFKNMKNLKSIKIQLSEGNDTEMLKSLPADIEEITLKSSQKYTYSNKFSFSKDFENFSDKWTSLRSLSLESLAINKTTHIIFNKNHSLTHLSVVSCDFYPEDLTELLMSTCKNLKHLTLMNIRSYFSDIIEVIANNLKNLSYLNITSKYLSLSALKKLGKLENLEEIILHNTRVDDNVLAEFKNLKMFNCAQSCVTDTGVIGILDRSPDLERLDIFDTNITANSLLHAANLSNYRDKKLVLRANKKVIDNFHQRNEISHFLELKK